MIIIIYITEGIYFAFNLEEAVILFCNKEILLLLFVQLCKNSGNLFSGKHALPFFIIYCPLS